MYKIRAPWIPIATGMAIKNAFSWLPMAVSFSYESVVCQPELAIFTIAMIIAATATPIITTAPLFGQDHL